MTLDGLSGLRLLARRAGVMQIVFVAILFLTGIFASALAPYDPAEQFRGAFLAPPSWEHLLGTDHLGRDLLSRTLYGLRVSLVVALGGVIIGAAIGVPFGLISGVFGGWIDAIFMRLCDLILAFPTILIGIAIAIAYGRGVGAIVLTVAIFNVPNFARLTRSRVLELRELDYVAGLLALGVSRRRLMVFHLLPNAMAPIVVTFGVAVGYGVFLEAALSFLGLGVQPPDPSLGQMLSTARGYLSTSPLYGIVPGLTVTLIVVAANLMTDAIADKWHV